MINNRNLIPLFYIGLKGENLTKDEFYDTNSFESVNVRFKVLELKEFDEEFFDDFIILEEILEQTPREIKDFCCIVNYDNKIYAYEVNTDRSIDIFRVYNDPSPESTYYPLGSPEDDVNYEILISKEKVLCDLIFNKSKYRIAELLKEKNSDINYIKF